MAIRESSVSKKKRGAYEPQDEFFHLAKEKGFVARSALKLEEIDKKHKLLKRGMKVLDFGSAPGSWLQYVSKKIAAKGVVVGTDLVEIRVSAKNIVFFQADLFEIHSKDHRIVEHAPYDLFLSDAMIKTTGIADADSASSLNLVEHCFQLAQSGLLKADGSFLAKIFEGPGFPEFYADFKRRFKKTRIERPKAIRKSSREAYVLGLGLKEQR